MCSIEGTSEIEEFVVDNEDLPVRGGAVVDAVEVASRLDKSCLTPTSKAARSAA